MPENPPAPGSISWFDLTVPDARPIRDFYAAVVGWKSTGFNMGDYEDFCMNRPGDGTTVAGICNARGPNAGIPAQWLIYIHVADLDRSLVEVANRGGKVIQPPREMGDGRVAFIQDPAGATCALYQSIPKD